MPTETRVMAVFAHPDDESFLCAGTMAMFIQDGAQVAVVSATRGEAGEIAENVDATPDNLGLVREQELRSAMGELGIEDVRFLGYRDSGMSGTPENEHPQSLAQASIEKVGIRVREIVDEFRPSILITFGPEGVYLHPDHIAVHHAVMAAIHLAVSDAPAHRVTTLVFTAMPREMFLELWSEPGNRFEDVPYETLIQMGTPRAEITHTVDVESFLEKKRAALKQHRSQFGDGEPLAEFDPEMAHRLVRYEHFKEHRLPWCVSREPSFPLGQVVPAGSA